MLTKKNLIVKRTKQICSLFLLLTLIFLPSSIFSGTAGKISGKIIDKDTNEPLPGCNVMIEGTTMGAASDINGMYYILNIPPGTYSVRATMVGFQTFTVTNVQVISDFTTDLNFTMSVQSLEMDQEVIVIADRPLVKKDETNKIAVVSSDDIMNMPANTINEILTTKAGFTVDASGDIHVRGGRTDEISFMVDGVKMEDPLYRDYNNNFNKDAISEMVIISGTFNAEYGDAMSGIVNITTRDGGDTFHGRVEYTSPMLNESPYRTSDAYSESGVEDEGDYVESSVLDRSDIAIPGQLRLSINGPIVSKLSYFLSGYVLNEDSYLPHGYNIANNVFGKLSYFATPTLKFALSGEFTNSERQGYSHSWKYRSDHQSHTNRDINRGIFMVTHTVSSKFFYVANLSRFENKIKSQVGDKDPSEYVMRQTGETVYFYVAGDDARYSDNRTVTYRAKIDATFQANNFHQFKGGFEFVSHNIDVHDEIEPWPSGSNFKDIYSKSPIEFSTYIQDKIEYNYLVVNAGLRLDYVDAKATMWPDINRFGYIDENNEFVYAEEVPVDPQLQISPRIGLAHPITDQAVLHFAYGHFFQNPNYNALYYNSVKDMSTTLPIVGNPGVKAQKTVSFEAGIKFQISDNWALDVTAWYKDITDLLSTLQMSYLSQDYVVYYNSDYASVKGIDVTFTKRYSSYFSGSIDYSYMVAKGNNSQPLGGYFSAFTNEEIPHKEYFLDFDQRHTFAINLSFFIPKDHGFWSDLNFNFIYRASSGLPYTPYVDPTVRIEINSARKPWVSTFDFRLQKRFPISTVALAWFFEVTNLFDTENVLWVYSRTGKPYDNGQPGLVGSSPDANYNPGHVGPPRTITTGVQFIW